MGKAFDVIVMGTRCAGSPTAMLLARRGYRIGVKVARASIDTDVFEEARAGAAQALVFCGGSNGWLVVE